MIAGSRDDRRRGRRRAAALIAGAAIALGAGCRATAPSSLDRDFPRDLAAVSILDAPAGPRGADLDLQWEWGAAIARQRVREKDAPWVFRRFPDLVVLDGEAHRSFLQLPSRDGSASLVAFRVRVPAGARPALVAWTAIAPKVAGNSDGVDAAIGVDAADGHSPADVALAWERVAGGDPQRWRKWTRDLSGFAGRTVWIVFGSRDTGSRVADSLLWGDTRVMDASGAPVVVDLGAPRGVRRRMDSVPWSAATFFKTYSLFSDEALKWLKPEWTRESFPWLRSLRFLSALGANWGPTLAEHPEEGGATASWESPLAKRYEFFTGSPPAPVPERFSWETYDRLNATAAASGLALHFNMSGAPEAFTGGRGMYRNYHVNELAVVDVPGWQTYVDTLFGHLAAQPWFSNVSVSFFSEPNCVWTEFDGVTVRKVGFQGDAAAYARQYVATWQAMKRWVPPDRVHLGPWVLELHGERPQDSAITYIRAMRAAFAAAGEAPPRWDAFAFNLYETPQISVEHFTAAKLGFARAVARRAVPERSLRINIDEFGVHPLVAEALQQATGTSVYATRWEMSWQAEMLATLARERVATAASWFPSYMAWQPQALRAYLPYFALSEVAGAISSTAADGALDATRAPPDAAPRDVWIDLATRNASRVGSMTSVAPDGVVRAAVWRHPRYLVVDAHAAAEERVPVEVRLPASAASWAVRVLGYEDQLGDALGGRQTQLRFKAFPQVSPLRRVELETGASFTLPIGAGDVYLVEATPR